MLNITNMSFEDCRSYLLNINNWKYRKAGCKYFKYKINTEEIIFETKNNPYSYTVECAISSLPENWKMYNIGWNIETIESKAIDKEKSTVMRFEDKNLIMSIYKLSILCYERNIEGKNLKWL